MRASVLQQVSAVTDWVILLQLLALQDMGTNLSDLSSYAKYVQQVRNPLHDPAAVQVQTKTSCTSVGNAAFVPRATFADAGRAALCTPDRQVPSPQGPTACAIIL